jgi:putative zinc finger/helix-turn-helix YgiT family protein
MNEELLRSTKEYCPICGKVHVIEEWSRIATTIIKNDVVSYPETYLFCANADEDECEYVDGSMLNANLLNARNAYRKMHGLLTSDEIVAIRDMYGLSQVDMARMMGWGEATISRYESKAIQDDAYDVMLRLVLDNPLKALEMLENNKDKFDDVKYESICSKIKAQLKLRGREYLSRQTLESMYVDYLDLSDKNGFVLLNIDKIEAASSFFAERVSNLFKVKLMKMLWYADALKYKTYGVSMTGLVYTHEAMGALPLGHRQIMSLENLAVREESTSNYDVLYHVYPNPRVDGSVLSEEDKLVLKQVANKFKGFTAQDIKEYMHRESAYMETKDGEVIPFSMAGKIREF